MSSPGNSDASPSASDVEGEQEVDSMGNPLTHRSGVEKRKSKPKAASRDPSRPKRKKAKRACLACQRAHLTCDDGRPCKRCSGRGIADKCQDGHHKLAKYLRDSPSRSPPHERIGPTAANGAHQLPSAPNPVAMGTQAIPVPHIGGNYYSPSPAVGYLPYPSVPNQNQLAPSMTDDVGLAGAFGQAPNIESPTQYQTGHLQAVQPVPGMETMMDQSGNLGGQVPGVFDPSMLDANDPMLFNNLNLADANFDNRYGALEFGMLGHLSSTALGSPEFDLMNLLNSNQGNMPYDGTVPNFGYDNNFQAWHAIPSSNLRQNSASSPWDPQKHAMDGSSTYSPLSQKTDFGNGHPKPSMTSDNQFSPEEQGIAQNELLRQSVSHAQEQKAKKTQFPASFGLSGHKRRRDTSKIYTSITSPFPYTEAFHDITAFLRARYPRAKLSQIAQSLSLIRPSLICSIGSLDDGDLVFMEKSLQRSIVELEIFYDFHSVPTIILRRTGHIVSVNKEFSHISGWSRDVLLGKEPNLNANFGRKSLNSGTQTGSSTRGTATPRVPNQQVDADPNKPKNAFIGDVLDQDSVCRFFEIFAELGFSASDTSTKGEPCTVLKYRTARDLAGLGAESDAFARVQAGSGGDANELLCQAVWSIKHDTFDIPMLIILQLLPDMSGDC